MDSVAQIVENIYRDIETRNRDLRATSIPQSDEFLAAEAKRYSLPVSAVEKMIQVLIESHRIFSFNTVDSPSEESVVHGYVIADGPLLELIRKIYEDELVIQYMNSFTAKLTPDKVKAEVSIKWDQFNGTQIGRIFRVTAMLEKSARILERDILKYGKKFQEKQFAIEIEKCASLNLDPAQAAKKEPEKPGTVKKDAQWVDVAPQETLRKAVSGAEKTGGAIKELDLKNPASRLMVEKSIRVYGIEFYSRTCFKNYQFSFMQKVVADQLISGDKDISIVKDVLRKVRANSDNDENLQKYAADINQLDKLLNEYLKK